MIMIFFWISICLSLYYTSKCVTTRVEKYYSQQIDKIDDSLFKIVEEMKSNLAYNQVQDTIKRYDISNELKYDHSRTSEANLDANNGGIEGRPVAENLNKIESISFGRPTFSPDMSLAPSRTFCERFLDSFFSDGPNNKYALICNKCFGHNGLSMHQELRQKKFTCAFCHTPNEILWKQ
ncbi:MAG: hypothetical protein MHMPM18_003223 [Marteilia pararefringens]